MHPSVDIQSARKAIIKVGYSCNNKCSFCHVDVPVRQRKSSSLDMLKKKVLAARKLGCSGVLFSGGEVTIRKDLSVLVATVGQSGMFAGLITNGRVFCDKQLLTVLYANGLRYIYVSFLSAEKKIQERMTGVNSYTDVLGGIRNIVRLPIYLKVNITLTKDNLSSLERTVGFLIRVGVVRIKICCVEPKGRALKSFMSMVPRYYEVMPVVKRVFKKYSQKAQLGLDGFPFCVLDGYAYAQDDLFTEHIAYMSEAFEDSFYPTDQGSKGKIDLCGTCALSKRCPGIYAQYVRHYGSDEFEPIERI